MEINNKKARARSKSFLVASSYLCANQSLQSSVSITKAVQLTEVKNYIISIFNSKSDEQELIKAYYELVGLFENSSKASCAEYLVKNINELIGEPTKQYDLEQFVFTASKLAESNIGAAKSFLTLHIDQKIQFSRSQLQTIKKQYDKVPGFLEEFSSAFNASSPRASSSIGENTRSIFDPISLQKNKKYRTHRHDQNKESSKEKKANMDECSYRSFAAKYLSTVRT